MIEMACGKRVEEEQAESRGKTAVDADVAFDLLLRAVLAIAENIAEIEREITLLKRDAHGSKKRKL